MWGGGKWVQWLMWWPSVLYSRGGEESDGAATRREVGACWCTLVLLHGAALWHTSTRHRRGGGASFRDQSTASHQTGSCVAPVRGSRIQDEGGWYVAVGPGCPAPQDGGSATLLSCLCLRSSPSPLCPPVQGLDLPPLPNTNWWVAGRVMATHEWPHEAS